MSVAMWEEKLAAESRRKQQLQQQQRQKPRRKSGFSLADTDVQVQVYYWVNRCRHSKAVAGERIVKSSHICRPVQDTDKSTAACCI